MKMVSFIGAAAAIAIAGPALAGNLLVNGSFESGFSGWSQTFSAGTAPVTIGYGVSAGYPTGAFGEAILPNNVGSLSPDAVGGNLAYFSSDFGGPDIIQQDIFLVAGKTYDVGLDFYFPANGLANPNSLFALFSLGGQTLTSGGPGAGKVWSNYATSYTAAFTGVHTLKFQFSGLGKTSGNYAADMAIDRVYVNAPVPEPATWAMMIGGLGLVGASMRRRKAAVSFA